MSRMKFWVGEPPPQYTTVRSDPEQVCHNGHEECADFHKGPCSMFPCTCETDGRCMSCVEVAVDKKHRGLGRI